jgi:CheY-like chemotaxis protein
MPSDAPRHLTLEATQDILLALGASNTAVWLRQPRAEQLEMNADAFALLGITAPAGPMAVAMLRSRVHPDDLPAVLAATRQSLLSPAAVDVQARYRHEDGSWRLLLSRCTALRGADGRLQAFAGTAIDTTVQFENARLADATTRRFERVTRTAGIGYWTFSTGDRAPIWSLPLRDLYGLLPHEDAPPVDAWLTRFVHADDRQAVSARLAGWRSSSDSSAEVTVAHRIVRRDGAVRHLLSHARRDAAAGGEDSYGVAIDLTERRVTELKLQSVAARAALAARAIGMGAWEVDLETREAIWDEQMFALRGVPVQPGTMPADARLALVHPDDRERVNRINTQAHSTSAPVEMEFRVLWPNGTVRWLGSRSLELAPDDDGKRRRIGVNWDITDKHQAQQALQLREAALRESQARERAKSQFLSRMSHELRTPLNAVLGFTQLLLAEADVAASPTRQQQLMHIQTAGNHLLSLVNHALELSNVQSGDMPTSRQTASLTDGVAAVLPPVTPKQLLYVEDNPVNALIVKELLSRRSDLQLHIAIDGSSGIQQALQLMPDLILIDMQLPDMDGLQVLSRLRAEPTLAHIACIALSANVVPEDIQRALNAGMADYWTKPLDFNAFLKGLDKLFGPAPARPTVN